MPRADSYQASTLGHYVTVIGRHKWFVFSAMTAAGVFALGASFRQASVYEASAEVLLVRQNPVATPGGTQDPASFEAPDRLAQTQADLARVPAVARRALEAAHVSSISPRELLDASTVAPRTNSDFLEFRVRARTRALAMTLATHYAQSFTEFRRELDASAIRRAITELNKQLALLVPTRGRGSSLYSSLRQKKRQLQILLPLQSPRALVVRIPDRTAQVQPRPLRNVTFGVIAGTILGIAMVFVGEALSGTRPATEIRQRVALRGGGSTRATRGGPSIKRRGS